MLTYRALQTNSETIGCEIAAYVYQHPVTFSGTGSDEKCAVAPGPAAGSGIVVMPFDQSIVNSFQAWRASMAIMAELKVRTAKYCGVPESGAPLQGKKGADAAVALSALGPAGDALGLAQGVLGAFATQAETVAVTGTIQDQAFLDGVVRQLRVLGIPVLTPADYAPYALGGVDAGNSPFLTAFQNTLTLRDCMIESAARNPADKVLAEQVAELNSFVASFGASVSASKAAPETRPAPAPAPKTSDSTPVTPAISGPTASGLTQILLADGLAQQLGISAEGKLSPSSPWQHILFVKALESGGTITRTSNILGTRIRYSGGSVGTFALIRPEGALECSGNVFDYGGNVAAKSFERDYRHYSPRLSSQLVFTRGSCEVK